MTDTTIDLYTDVKSPYAYLAVAPARTLARDYRVVLNWRPYTLRIPDFLGSAKVNADGSVVEEARTPHQWRRVRYSYMDVRRYANLRGLTVRGPRKIWDFLACPTSDCCTPGDAGADVLDAYLDAVYERFWKRELDIEDRDAVAGVLGGSGVPMPAHSRRTPKGRGARRTTVSRNEAEAAGGVRRPHMGRRWRALLGGASTCR